MIVRGIWRQLVENGRYEFEARASERLRLRYQMVALMGRANTPLQNLEFEFIRPIQLKARFTWRIIILKCPRRT